ncbi:MAG: zinc-binding dehydrogenase [Planctomycetota bacterium]
MTSSPNGATALNGTMQAARITKHGGLGAVSVVNQPIPEPGFGEVLVEIHAVGLNHLDLWVRRGVPGHKFPLPLTPGCDGAGIVVSCGAGVSNVTPGEAVIISPGTSCGACKHCLSGRDPLCRDYGIFGETRDGTCAEYACIPAANVVPKPDSVAFHEAGCFALVALTAWTMLVERARIEPGEDVLILAGGSGVGSLGIQIAKLFGCRVIATAGSDAKLARLRELGADDVIHHGHEDIAGRVKELTDKRGVDVVFEHVGEATWQASLRSLAWGGRLVTCGATTGAHAECDLRMIFFKSLSILGSTMGSKGVVPQLVQLLGEGRLRAPIATTIPLSKIETAHRLLEERHVFGKVVVVPDRYYS